MTGYKLLDTFRAAFEGKIYKHRDSSIGDLIANQLYELSLRSHHGKTRRKKPLDVSRAAVT